ncbi:hypothetical protein B0E46_15925 [Rhodanobacter sp. B04]|nr:hypothetical protein B0E46_15925 [Rhodanobacter sp. B04]
MIFTTSTCPFCKKTRYILESNGIEYKDYVTDVTKTAEEQYLSLGEKNVPIILIGNTKLRGLNEKELIQVLNANKICGTNLCKTPAALSAKI